ncbi:Aste57867_2559 [Aphanomyces stellatus]|uniref:Aste57867_2559 protein n=1 Tax=Aphanomyces stellatus TaxID=120398 RepID=A0A485K8Y0_9STRA|nr:hypothetical protein As57867_002552 [Aphanomyces stellatus]VFT79755.1 Aste57867_2559 [Aphanomyces stellatus]
MMVANFRGLAAAWYQERLHSRREAPSTLLELENELRDEFEPDDLQDRLRDQLYELEQAHCASLTENVAKFRRICTQNCDITERDKVSWFQRGFRTHTYEELQYRRCETVTTAIQVALDYERSHSLSLDDRHHRARDRNNRNDRRPQHGHHDRRNAHTRKHQKDDMEVDNAQVQPRSQRQVGPCFNYGRMGHRISECRSPHRNYQGRSQGHQQLINSTPRPTPRFQRNAPSRQHNAQVNEVASDTEYSEDDVVEMILGNNMDLAEHSEDDFVYHRTAIGLMDAPAEWITVNEEF